MRPRTLVTMSRIVDGVVLTGAPLTALVACGGDDGSGGYAIAALAARTTRVDAVRE